MGYYAVIGVVAGWIDVGARAYVGHRRRWGYLIACGLLFFFAITSTQYNLRSATRLCYYAVAAVAVWEVASRVRFTRIAHRSWRA